MQASRLRFSPALEKRAGGLSDCVRLSNYFGPQHSAAFPPEPGTVYSIAGAGEGLKRRPSPASPSRSCLPRLARYKHSALSIQPGNIREDQNRGRASVKSILLLLNSALRCVIPGNQRLGPKHEAGCAPAGAAASAANNLLTAKSSSGLERNDKMVGAKRNNLWSEAT